jgi:cytochrome c
MKKLLIAVTLAAFAAPGIASADEALAKSNGCLKCHAVDKGKMGPSYKDVAKKYKGNAGAQAKLTTFLAKGAKVKVDGADEDHKPVKGGEADAAKLSKWILSL